MVIEVVIKSVNRGGEGLQGAMTRDNGEMDMTNPFEFIVEGKL